MISNSLWQELGLLANITQGMLLKMSGSMCHWNGFGSCTDNRIRKRWKKSSGAFSLTSAAIDERSPKSPGSTAGSTDESGATGSSRSSGGVSTRKSTPAFSKGARPETAAITGRPIGKRSPVRGKAAKLSLPNDGSATCGSPLEIAVLLWLNCLNCGVFSKFYVTNPGWLQTQGSNEKLCQHLYDQKGYGPGTSLIPSQWPKLYSGELDHSTEPSDVPSALSTSDVNRFALKAWWWCFGHLPSGAASWKLDCNWIGTNLQPHWPTL